ncbi:MAG: hypothetical protein WCB02_31070, partial [Bradyrhizobium sp.]
GPFRSDGNLRLALGAIARLSGDLGEMPLASAAGFDPVLLDWLDLRNMLLVAEAVVLPALARTESRGAHQREDHPGLDDIWSINQIVALSDGKPALSRAAPVGGRAAA